jgi:hypothetical protein
MPCDNWFNLDTKKIRKSGISWMTMPILEYENGVKTLLNKPFTKPSSFQRKVNLHEISAYDLIQAYSHQMGNASPEDGDKASSNDHHTPVKDGQDDSDTRIVNAATSSS